MAFGAKKPLTARAGYVITYLWVPGVGAWCTLLGRGIYMTETHRSPAAAFARVALMGVVLVLPGCGNDPATGSHKQGPPTRMTIHLKQKSCDKYTLFGDWNGRALCKEKTLENLGVREKDAPFYQLR
jgi:hypothetical protein